MIACIKRPLVSSVVCRSLLSGAVGVDISGALPRLPRQPPHSFRSSSTCFRPNPTSSPSIYEIHLFKSISSGLACDFHLAVTRQVPQGAPFLSSLSSFSCGDFQRLSRRHRSVDLSKAIPQGRHESHVHLFHLLTYKSRLNPPHASRAGDGFVAGVARDQPHTSPHVHIRRANTKARRKQVSKFED